VIKQEVVNETAAAIERLHAESMLLAKASDVASAETEQEMLPPDENTWKITFAGQVSAAREEIVATETGDDGEIAAENAVWIGSRPVLTQEEATDPDYLQQALIPRSSETHSGEDVAIYASGPWAHLFDGTVEQNYIFHVMQHAASVE
jgi:alkaline phosphatase